MEYGLEEVIRSLCHSELMARDGCPLCKHQDAEIVDCDSELGHERWSCYRCRDFFLLRPYTSREALQASQPHLLSGIAVQRHLRGERPPRIGPDTVDQLLAQAPSHPAEKPDRLLLNLAYGSSEAGMMTNLDSRRDRSYAFVKATDAFTFWLEFLAEDGLIEYEGERSPATDDLGFRLTGQGWRRVQELQEEGLESGTGFVAMRFEDELEPLWSDAIKPAIEDAGWGVIRADKEEHTQKIDDWILNRIEDSRFMVVETTGNNPGVCFEAGYALALGRPVIWLVSESFLHGDEEGEENGLHFDIRQYNHLTWEEGKEAGLRSELRERIVSIVGRRTHEPGAGDFPP